jgi:very-short-patch-repair endonuclease
MKKHPTDGAHERAKSLRRNMTDAERAMWQILRSRQIEHLKFRRQVPIGRYIGDFVCHQARLVIEIDGGQHDASSRQETARMEFLEREGYRVLRFWNNDVLANPDGVYSMIVEELHWHHPHPALRADLPHQGGGI